VQEPTNLAVVDYAKEKGYQGKSLGMGVRTDVARKALAFLPLLVWGKFTTEEKWIEQAQERGDPTDFPHVPGVFALQKPYEKCVCVISDNCPARYVNDSIGIPNCKPNIHFVQHPDLRELFHDPMKGVHLFLQAQALHDIEPGEQLFTSYGKSFWEEGAPICRQDIDEAKLEETGEESEIGEAKEVDSEDEPLLMTPLSSKSTSIKVKNALTMTPATPINFEIADKEVNDWIPPSPVSSGKKKVTKSGCGNSSRKTKTTSNEKKLSNEKIFDFPILLLEVIIFRGRADKINDQAR